MEFFFNENNVDEVLSKIQGEIDGREMGKILRFLTQAQSSQSPSRN